MKHQGSVLVIEDDLSIRRTLQTTLTALGFTIGEASSGEEGLLHIQTTRYDAILLDINMPGLGGIETCRSLREVSPGVPILMLTVRDSEDDKVEALECGADDYITKPFRIRELIARLRAAIRRQQRSKVHLEDACLKIGEVLLDPLRHRVEKSSKAVALTPKEFDTLYYLMQHAGQPVTHKRLLMAVWGPEFGNEREYLRVIIRQLRLKLENVPSEPQYLLTEPYIGYRFAEEDA